MALTLSDLKAKRTQVKSKMTRFKTYINKLETDTSIIGELEDRKLKFESLWDTFETIQSNIELIIDGENEEDSNFERENFESMFFELNSKAKVFLSKHNSTHIMLQRNESEQSLQSVSSHFRARARLPEIELPKFSGAYDEWYNFFNTFHSLIHNNDHITKVDKLQYLKSSLKSEASEILTSLEITEENYDIAWEMLKDRYDDKRAIISKHIQAILDLPSSNKENHIILRQLIDGITKHLRVLNSLKRPVDTWDDLLIHILVNKIDPTTIKEWEASLSRKQIPTLKDLIDFITQRCNVLSVIARKNHISNIKNQFNPSSNFKSQNRPSISAPVAVVNQLCAFCNEEHFNHKCDKFLKLNINKRIQEAKQKFLCINCLKRGHSASKCTSGSCKKCYKRHHTLLHLDYTQTVSSSAPNAVATTVNHSFYLQNPQQILLSTAIVHVYDANGNTHECRALLDSGSQSNFITESLISRLNIKTTNVQLPIIGINQAVVNVNRVADIKIKSRFNSFNTNLKCLILNKITEKLPIISFDKSNMKIPKNIKLADPNFNISTDIDLLIGAEIFWSLLCIGQIRLGNNQPTLQKSHYGWIISGRTHEISNLHNKTVCNFTTCCEDLNSNVKRFWELEEYDVRSIYSPQEKEVEEHFLQTFTRNKDGRFVVKLPLKQDILNKLGNSKAQAVKRFYSLERKFARHADLKEQYSAFIAEYESLGHMVMLSDTYTDSDKGPTFYLPHHAVIKQSSLTTKLRVVFDGSAKSSTGISLNDALMAGPVLQHDLFSIILRFRTYKYVMTADIAKMYRQICVNRSDTPLQRILWRNNPNERLKTYELTTVTYGTTSASFLAIRALHQLAQEEQSSFPIGSKITLRDFYVDDLLTGANTFEEAQIICNEVYKMLKIGGFELRKWISNFPDILQNISMNNTEYATVNLDKEENVKTLGLQWNSHLDILQYSVPEYNKPKITKRIILASISQIFDPLGLISPVIITAKILIQQLWQLNLNWDESVPINIHSQWTRFKEEIIMLKSLKIPRWIAESANAIRRELHGFSDSSESAYGACIYMRTTYSIGKHTVRLICAKSRVAPLKNISLPRLELCGALLLARLMNKVRSSIYIPIDDLFYWSDSTIVIGWIKSTSTRVWKTFVANRVSEIQDLTNISKWNHVNTNENAADIVTRGKTPKELLYCDLWWNGPNWLHKDINNWPTSLGDSFQELPERKAIISVYTAVAINDDLLSRYSDINKLFRITALCLRFINNSRQKLNENNQTIHSGPITVEELKESTICIVKIVQRMEFNKEIQELTKSNQVSPKSKLICLTPFLDDCGIIRVGGRLSQSQLGYDEMHPIVLPKNHVFTKLLIRKEHENQFHSGVQTTLAAIRKTYWPLDARNSVRHIIRKCIICFKARPRSKQCMMADLPASRITSSRPFSNCGIDYFGPLYVREGKRRNSKIIKAYGVIFICFATKAVHIDLVNDLSSESFLAALKRFIARRGKPSNIYSDNGTNFVGANRELKELRDMFLKEKVQNKIISSMSNLGITWHFIPARSPHFGGLWEAAVKSAKHCLFRVTKGASLNTDQMITLLTQIEAILNSRPLTPLSTDPNDTFCLTPAHFLIGDSLNSINVPDLKCVLVNRLSHWQHVEQLRQHFWSRWSKEYLNQLQQRTKWKTRASTQLEPGQLVIIREDNLPALRWLLGRVEIVHPGQDGIVRAATVRTTAGLIKRASVKLCPLPLEN